MPGGAGSRGGCGRNRSGPSGQRGVTRPDSRTHEQKSKIKWNTEWLTETDSLGDTVGEWAEKVDGQSAKCLWCYKHFKYNALGKHTLLRHAKSDQHKLCADGRKGRISGQPSLAPPPADENENDVAVIESGQASTRRDVPRIGTGHFGAQRLSAPPSIHGSEGSLKDRVLAAEIRWSFKVVSSGYSYKSCNDLVDVLQLMDSSSDIFKKMTLKEDKISYTISHGLFPFYMRKLLDAVKKSPGVSLGTDASTFKQQGLSQHVDICLRFWDDTADEVVDSFLDFHSVGHDPADKQVGNVLTSLENASIPLSKIVCLSRDNPHVMQKVFRLLEEECRIANNKKLVDAPCYLHPMHTAFKKAMECLGLNIGSLLSNSHSWFKTSTARRADLVEVREEIADSVEDALEEILNEFFLRHVGVRWLESGPCIDRFLKHWESTVEYFGHYLPNSPLQNNKKALESKMYKSIMKHLCDEEKVQTKIRLKFLSFLAQQTKTFLTLLQAERPMIHLLQELALTTFQRIARLVIKASDVPKAAKDVLSVDLADKEILLSQKDCGYLVNMDEDIRQLTSQQRNKIRVEMRESTLVMLRYLQSSLPFDKVIYSQFGFIDPKKRINKDMAKNGVAVATFLNRFNADEKEMIGILLNQYGSLPEEQIPRFDQTKDRVDHHWVKVWKVLEQVNGEKPEQLIKLVKLVCIQTHGNAFLERSLGLTKRIVSDRNSLKDVSVKAQKVVTDVVKRYGGPSKVPITTSLLNAVKYAAMKEREELQKAREAKNRMERESAQEEEARKRKREEDASRQKWEETRLDLESKIKGCKSYIDAQYKIQKEAMDKGLKYTNSEAIKMSMRTANFAREAVVKKTKELSELQDKVKHHMAKKPKYSN